MKIPAQLEVWFGIYWRLERLERKLQTPADRYALEVIERGVWDYQYLTRRRIPPASECVYDVREEVGLTDVLLPIYCAACGAHSEAWTPGGRILKRCASEGCASREVASLFPGAAHVRAMLRDTWPAATLDIAWLTWLARRLARP